MSDALYEKILAFWAPPGPRIGNVWLKAGPISIYIRKVNRVLYVKEAGRLVAYPIRNVLDIGNVRVDPRRRGKGLFTALLRKLEDEFPCSAIYVENVHNPALWEFFHRDPKYLDQSDLSFAYIKPGAEYC